MSHNDALGNPINVGDYIAYASMRGDTTDLKLGKVMTLKQSKPRWEDDDRIELKLGIRAIDRNSKWDAEAKIYSWYWAVQKNGKEITVGLRNVAVLSAGNLSKEQRALLDAK